MYELIVTQKVNKLMKELGSRHRRHPIHSTSPAVQRLSGANFIAVRSFNKTIDQTP
jgi:hypothetical protein